MGLPPVVVGVVVLLLLLPGGAFGSLRIEFTIKALYVVQTILALPYIVALDARGDPGAARRSARPGAGAPGAGRFAAQRAGAAQEAKIQDPRRGDCGGGLDRCRGGGRRSIIVGSDFQGHDQTLGPGR